ncbi:hypothetical protein KJ953_04110 [Patescibacteria group bacterium]|nr:hypothetical protein [Patescibacteria group bacterium]
MSSKYMISSQGSCVGISLKNIDPNLFWKELVNNPLLYRFIPDLSFKGRPLIELEVVSSSARKVSLMGVKTLIQGLYKKDFNSTDVIVVVEYLLEKLRQKKDIFTIHSSAIFKGNKGVLLVANLTGAGKTSGAIYLSKNYDFEIYSDEKTQINSSMEMVGQVSKVIVEDKARKLLGDNNVFLDKNIEIIKTNNKKLCLIVIPQLVEASNSISTIQYTKEQVKWLVYEELSKDIRLINGLVFNFTYPLMSLDKFEFAQKREKLAEDISLSIPVFLVKGSLVQISAEINRIFELHA